MMLIYVHNDTVSSSFPDASPFLRIETLIPDIQMFILRSPHRAYDTRYMLICNDDFSQKIGGQIDVQTFRYPDKQTIME